MQTDSSVANSIDALRFHESWRLPSGYAPLDQLAKGLARGSVWSVCGPRHSRSAFLAGIVSKALDDDRSVLYIAVRGTSSEVEACLAASHLNVPISRVISCDSESISSTMSMDRIGRWKISVVGGETDLESEIWNALGEHAFPLDLLVIDDVDIAPDLVVRGMNLEDFSGGPDLWWGPLRRFAAVRRTAVVCGVGARLEDDPFSTSMGMNDMTIDIQLTGPVASHLGEGDLSVETTVDGKSRFLAIEQHLWTKLIVHSNDR